MGGKLNVYNLGSLGVNVDKNPVQLEDGELTKAQNAIHDPTGSMGGVRKRPGLTKINSGALSGSVFGICNVPLQPITLRSFYIGIDQDSTTNFQWVRTTDDFASTAEVDAPPAAPNSLNDERFGAAIWNLLTSKAASIEGAMLYVAEHAPEAPIPIRIYDGTQDRELFTIPINAVAVANTTAAQYAGAESAVRQMLVEGNKLYLVVHDFHNTAASFDNYSRVLEYDFDTGVLRQLGQGCNGSVSGDIGDGAVAFTCIELHQGYLYVGVGTTDGTNSTDAGIWRLRPDIEGSLWTQDYTGATNEIPLCLQSYKGLLYAGFTDFDAAAAPLKVRAADGTWSNSTTIGGATTNNAWVAMAVFGDNLYATSYENTGTDESKIYKFDGSSWSAVKTIDTAADPRIGVDIIIHNGKIYVLARNQANAGIVTHSSNGTSWTDQSTNLGVGVTCAFAVFTD